MDLREAVNQLVTDAKNIEQWLRVEGETLNRADLHILEVQLYLLQKEAAKWKDRKTQRQNTAPPFPPFKSTAENKKKK